MDTIGERIVFLREELDMSQKELAICIGIPPTSLSRYEHNLYEPKAEIIKRLSKALKTSSDFLLGQTDNYQLYPARYSMGLTAEEQRLLRYYRDLNEVNQARVQERIYTLSDVQ